MKHLLKTLDDYSRITVALSGIWLLVANLIYFSGLGGIHIYSFDHPESNSELATWQVVWRFLTFNLEVARPYLRSSEPQFPLKSLTFASFDEYSLIGHAVFMLLPILYICIAFAIVHWVRSGFNSKAQRDSNAL
jgi:hypothetical protein